MYTFFKSLVGSEFFRYDHQSGVMTIIVNDGCHKGLFTRCDVAASKLEHQYSIEQINGVPEHLRIYTSSDREEFDTTSNFVINLITLILT